MGEPDFIGMKGASIHGVGGCVVGDKRGCRPTVFRVVEWPQWVKDEVLLTKEGWNNLPPDMQARLQETHPGEEIPVGYLTNSDLEAAGMLLLVLVMEDVCALQPGSHLALYSDNSPTVSWVRRMAAKGSQVASQILHPTSY